MTEPNVDYYKILEVDPSASAPEIRHAYKRAALKHHPDRLPADSPDRPARTRKFQQINDAYYTLSDPRRRREYDASRRTTPNGPSGAGAGTAPPPPPPPPPPHDNADGTSSFTSDQFGSIFEEMLREEGLSGDAGEGEDGVAAEGRGHLWSVVGGMSGAGLGFIIANVPGALAGVVAGYRLGGVRDRKGKSVYQVFQDLPQEDRARVLSRLAARVLQSAVS